MKLFFVLCFTISVSLSGGDVLSQGIPSWIYHGKVADGGQIDAQAGPDGRVHLLSSSYYQFSAGGQPLLSEAVGDEKQDSMDFPPALAVDPQGNVHIITRHGSASSDTGYDIRYRMRDDTSGWQDDFWVGSPEKRNYVVGIAASGTDNIYFHSTKAGSDVWGDVRIWEKSGSSAQSMGELNNIWRADTDARMRGAEGKLFLVSGKCDSGGPVYFSFCNAGSTCFSELTGNLRTHSSGNGRLGDPDLYLDKQGSVHLTYGAEYEVYYNKYDGNQQLVFSNDQRIFSNLGGWHLSLGMSAVAASDDGTIVLAVALNPDGNSQGATNSELLWCYSLDGGSNWSKPESLGVYTDGGEGRRRPRLVAVGGTFFLFHRNNAEGGISLATITFDTGSVVMPGIMTPITNLLLE